jgi:hypothetical protein
MRADNVEVSWDNAKSKWVIRIQTGEEVIRRYSDLGKNADEPALRTAAQETLKDEGYEADASVVSIKRLAS